MPRISGFRPVPLAMLIDNATLQPTMQVGWNARHLLISIPAAETVY
jgi:hypothetical protein